MSQQDNPHDPQGTPSETASGAWASSPESNRPADGAIRAVSLQQVQQTWTAGEGATDFLGLEQESPGQAAAPAAAQAAGQPGPAELNPTQAWLFHMESGARGAVAAQAPAQTFDERDEGADAVDPAGADPLDAEGATADALEPELEPEHAGTTIASLEATLKRRKSRSLIAASLVAALLAAGGWQYWNGQSKTPPAGEPVATRGPSKGQKPKPKPAQAEAPKVAQVPPPVDSKPVDPVLTQADPAPIDVAVAPPPAGEPLLQPTPADPLALANPAPEPADFTPVPFPVTRSEDPQATLATPKGTRRPSPDEVVALWTERDIPYEAIAAESMLRTPRVGAVRVLLKNGEHFQGRLHSVGQGHVRMDLSLGRMSLDYAEVRELVQIVEADLTKKPSGGLPEETAGLMYVTAKVPGGSLTGWLVQRTDGKLTLITEQAKKVTFEDQGFEPVSKGRARVVGALDKEAAKPNE